MIENRAKNYDWIEFRTFHVRSSKLSVERKITSGLFCLGFEGKLIHRTKGNVETLPHKRHRLLLKFGVLTITTYK